LAATPFGICRGELGVGLFLFHGWRGSRGFCGDVEDESSSISPWWLSSSMASLDPRPRVLGAWPQPMCIQRCLISFLGTSVYFGSLQSVHAMELSRIWGRWCLVLASGDDRWRPMQEAMANTGSRDLFVIFLFSRSLCAKRFGQLSSVFYCDVPVFLLVYVRFP
jgi:hypothetical protein